MSRPDTGTNREERYRLRDERIRAIAAANPELSSSEIAARLGCGHRVVLRVVAAMRESPCAT